MSFSHITRGGGGAGVRVGEEDWPRPFSVPSENTRRATEKGKERPSAADSNQMGVEGVNSEAIRAREDGERGRKNYGEAGTVQTFP